MSQPMPNVQPEVINAFDFIPKLKHVLPRLEGIPGFYYLLVHVQNMKYAELSGWLEVANQPVWTIFGPKGQCDVKLYCQGERIPASDYQGSRRPYDIDFAICEITGITNVGGYEMEEPDPEPVEVAHDPEPEAPTEEIADPEPETFGGSGVENAQEP